MFTYFFIFTFQASDNHGDVGESQSSVVPLKVSLQDANDNPPAFAREAYTSAIDEKAPDFDPPLIVKVGGILNVTRAVLHQETGDDLLHYLLLT